MLPVLCIGMTSEIEQQIFKIFWGASIPLVVPPSTAFFSIYIHRSIRPCISGVASGPAQQD